MPGPHREHTAVVCDVGYVHARCCPYPRPTIERIDCPLPEGDEHPDTMGVFPAALDPPARRRRRGEVLLPCPHCNAVGTIAVTPLERAGTTAPSTAVSSEFDSRLLDAMERWVRLHPIRSGERIEGLVEIRMHPDDFALLVTVPEEGPDPANPSLAQPVEDDAGLIRDTWRGVTVIRDSSVPPGAPELCSAWRTAI